MNQIHEIPIYIVTGYSGAGKTIVLRALEDLGYFCIDNLPLNLLPYLTDFLKQPSITNKKIVLGIDIRTHSSINTLVEGILSWNKNLSNNKIKILFLNSSTQTLLKRFQETRRKHPLAENRDLSDAIKYEQELLKPIQDIANIFIDTDYLTIHELKNLVRDIFSSEIQPSILVNFISFGFKYGVPEESNFVYDIRSLPNPYFIPELKELNGTDILVQNYLFDQHDTIEYWNRLLEFIKFSIERTYKEGRFFIQIAIGCTGGKHRSVAFVDKLFKIEFEQAKSIAKHRDLLRDNI